MNRMKSGTLIFVFLISYNILTGQNVSGIVNNRATEKPVEFVNIGIVGKNIGTVTDINGYFNFCIESEYDADTLMFSSIGYEPYFVKVSDLRESTKPKIVLKEKSYEINEVIIKPKNIKEETLGVTTKFKKIAAGFKDNLLGYECGISMQVKKTAYIKKVNINISACSYDTIFYRLNIYRVKGKKNFENLLQEPIYIKLPKASVKEGFQIDLQDKNIIVDGDFLVTLEHVKDLGQGYMFFCAGLSEKTYYRKTSQGKWETNPIGISVSVIADVEK